MSKHRAPSYMPSMPPCPPDVVRYGYLTKIMDGMDIKQFALQDKEIESMAESGYELITLQQLPMGQTRLLFRKAI